MQGLFKDIFGLNHCKMRGNGYNRWLFAAMGLTQSRCTDSTLLNKNDHLRELKLRSWDKLLDSQNK